MRHGVRPVPSGSDAVGAHRDVAEECARRRPSTWPRALTLLPLLLLGGCSNLSRSSYDSLKLALHGRPAVHPTAATVAAKSYFQMQATGPDGSAVLILGNLDGARQAWYGTHGVIVFIEHGRVVQTGGLRTNLEGVRLPTDDPFARGLNKLSAPLQYRMSADWSPGYRYGVPIEATLKPAGRERIDILGQSHEVLRVDEQVASPSLDYRATNHYWVDPRDGFIWKSEQHVAPGMDLILVQLRPYRGQP